MILLAIILIILVLMYIVRISNNNDVFEKHTKTEEDLAKIKETKKQIKNSKISRGIMLASILVLLIMLICDFTSIDAIIIDFFAVDFYTESEFNRMFYFIPAFAFIAILIYNEVLIGDFLFEYYKVQEEELEIKINTDKIKGLLYKKKPTTEDTSTPQVETPVTPKVEEKEDIQKPEN